MLGPWSPLGKIAEPDQNCCARERVSPSSSGKAGDRRTSLYYEHHPFIFQETIAFRPNILRGNRIPSRGGFSRRETLGRRLKPPLRQSFRANAIARPNFRRCTTAAWLHDLAALNANHRMRLAWNASIENFVAGTASGSRQPTGDRTPTAAGIVAGLAQREATECLNTGCAPSVFP